MTDEIKKTILFNASISAALNIHLIIRPKIKLHTAGIIKNTIKSSAMAPGGPAMHG